MIFWYLLHIQLHRSRCAKNFIIKFRLFSYPSVKTCVLVAQKNHLIETVLLGTHNICFGWEIRKVIFKCTLLSGGLNLQWCMGSLAKAFTARLGRFRLMPKVGPLTQLSSCTWIFKGWRFEYAISTKHVLDYLLIISLLLFCVISFDVGCSSWFSLVVRKADFVACKQQRHLSSFEPVSSKRYRLACAHIKDSDQPAHLLSLISLQWALYW